jgi:ubiquinone/menaquinone biosynthesis C-methylase UbiE
MDTNAFQSVRAAMAREYEAPLIHSPSGAPAHAATLPAYLERHYAWAYVWPASVWFFDHQPIINAILFGNYRRIMRHTLRMMDATTAGRTLQIAGVYGELTPTLASQGIDDLHLVDAAPIQLEAARRKLAAIGKRAELRRMHAESLSYGDGAFDTALMFLLLHEMPPEARRAALREAIRVLKPGGRFVIAEYGEKRRGHFFHRFAPMRWILTKAEPFLGGFWSENLYDVLRECAAALGRTLVREEQVDIFGGFYRVARFRIG